MAYSKTLPNVLVNGIHGFDVGDPGVAEIGMNVLGIGMVVLCLQKDHIDDLIGTLIASKGSMDWPATKYDTALNVTESLALPTDGRSVVLRMFGAVPEPNAEDRPSPPAGHISFLLPVDEAARLGMDLVAAAEEAKSSAV